MDKCNKITNPIWEIKNKKLYNGSISKPSITLKSIPITQFDPHSKLLNDYFLKSYQITCNDNSLRGYQGITRNVKQHMAKECPLWPLTIGRAETTSDD